MHEALLRAVASKPRVLASITAPGSRQPDLSTPNSRARQRFRWEIPVFSRLNMPERRCARSAQGLRHGTLVEKCSLGPKLDPRPRASRAPFHELRTEIRITSTLQHEVRNEHYNSNSVLVRTSTSRLRNCPRHYGLAKQIRS